MPSETAARRLANICNRNNIRILGGWDQEFVGLPNNYIRIAIRYPFDIKELSRLFIEYYHKSF